LKLNQDSTFIQENFGCTFHYYATGRYNLREDTIQLQHFKIYQVNTRGRKKIIKDTTGPEYKFCKRSSQYIVVNNDIIRKIHHSLDGEKYEIAELKRKTETIK